MPTYTVTVERASHYTVEAPTPKAAADRVLLGDVKEDGQTTMAHYVYDEEGDCVERGP